MSGPISQAQHANRARSVTRVRRHARRTSSGSTTVAQHARRLGARHFTLPRGLSYKDAYRAVPRGVGDFTYDPKTGKAGAT